MKARWHLIILTAVTQLVMAGQLHAQDDPPAISATLRILFQRYVPPVRMEPETAISTADQNQPHEFYYSTPEGFAPVTIESNKISEAIDYRGPAAFILYQRVAASSPEEQDTYTPALACQLPPSQGQSFLLLRQEHPGQKNSHLSAIPLDVQSIPQGSVYAYNLGQQTLQVATEEQRLTLAPDKGLLIHMPAGEPTHLQVLAAIGQEDGYRLVYRRHWPIREGKRDICVFFPTNDAMTRWSSRIIPLN